MSGHSKWANIKNRKGAQDKKRSEAFTKMAKNILTAIRVGGGNTNSESNLGLKMAIDKAKEVNMPKENIDRLISRFEERKSSLISTTLEGYGPFGIPIVIELETDNKNRILSEVKLIFRNYGGNLGENNSVMFQFKKIGEVEFENLDEENELNLIDMGIIDIEDKIVLVDSTDLKDFLEKIDNLGLKIIKSGLSMRTDNPIVLKDESELNKIMDMIEELEDNDDVINVFAGFDYKKV